MQQCPQKDQCNFGSLNQADPVSIMSSILQDNHRVVQLLSDRELIDYLVNNNYSKNKFKSTTFVLYLAQLLDKSQNLSIDESLEQKSEAKEIRAFLQNSTKIFSKRILELASSYFDFSVSVYCTENKKYWCELIGDRSNTTVNVILFNQHYYIEKGNASFDAQSQLRTIVSDLWFDFGIKDRKTYESLSLIQNSNIINTELTNPGKSMLADKLVNRSVTSREGLLAKKKPKTAFNDVNRIKDLEKRKLNYKKLSSTNEATSPTTVTSIPTKSYNTPGTDHSNLKSVKHQYISYSNLHQARSNQKQDIMPINNIHVLKEPSIKQEKYEIVDENFNKAIEFICTYQSQIKIKPANFNEKKGYKPQVIGKTDHSIKGKLKFYKHKQKFGFILLEDQTEVFLHKDNLMRARIESELFENCAKYFDILLKFKVLQYQGKNRCNAKAVDIEILNFVPKTKLN